MSTGYALPKELLMRLGLALLAHKRRSFRADAIRCASRLQPPLKIYGIENIPASGPCLVTANHYARPGSRLVAGTGGQRGGAGRNPLADHFCLDVSDRLRSVTITPVSRWVLTRLAQVYGFTNMPPMPPDPREVLRRAEAVRRVLKVARRSERPLIGLAPEGGDFVAPDRLAEPPPGAGRFISHLCALGLDISPVGIFEEVDCLCLRFGPRYRLEALPELAASARDRCTSQHVMRPIAELIPTSSRPE